MKRTAGFTLVELLIVIAIIAILMAILFPVLGRVREDGYKATCISNLVKLHLATAAYRQDFGVYPALPEAMRTLQGAQKLDKVLNCNKDSDPAHDTYNELYNYYGYQGGTLDPIALKSEADATAEYATVTNPHSGKADLMHPATMVDDAASFGGDFPGLANKNAGPSTIETVCAHHIVVYPGKYLILRVAGDVDFTKVTDTNFWALSLPASTIKP